MIRETAFKVLVLHENKIILYLKRAIYKALKDKILPQEFQVLINTQWMNLPN